MRQMFGGSVRRPQLDPVVVVAMANRKQGGAADGQVRAELRGREPEMVLHRQKGRHRCGQAGSTGGYRRRFEDLEVLFPEAHALEPGL